MLKKLTKFILTNVLSCVLIIFPLNNCFAQPDITRFYDSAHHWYDINDADKVIEPLPEQQKYGKTEFSYIADNILLFQKSNGGWAKNYDMLAELTDGQKSKVLASKNELNTTFDNGATYSQLTYLAEVYTILNEKKYRDAFLKGLDFILSAQYDNGGWPQFYPDTSGYRKYITYNDGAMIGVMELLYKIKTHDSNYIFIPGEYLPKVNKAVSKGIDCILNTQIIDTGKMTAWCQQHDNRTLKPQNARTFEPAAICNEESSEIVIFLMQINNPNERIKNSIESAVQWFKESAIHGIRVDKVEAPTEIFVYHTSNFDKVVVKDPNAQRIWTRFYQLGTHVPIFCRRDKKIVYTLAEVERERRTGYSWYNYDPEKVLLEYPKWKKKWE